jgi:hypothetical protein
VSFVTYEIDLGSTPLVVKRKACDNLILSMGYIAKRKAFLVWLGILGLLATNHVHARELHGRTGIGYNGQFGMSGFSGGVPGLSIKYGIARGIQIQGIGGFSTGSPTVAAGGFKYMQTLFPENYLNFYFMAGGALVGVNKNTGVEFIGGVGTEFFIPGIDSVGISFEAGAAFENATTGSFILKTFGASFLHAGMHFYF